MPFCSSARRAGAESDENTCSVKFFSFSQTGHTGQLELLKNRCP